MVIGNNAGNLAGALFRVVYFDGEIEIDLGTIFITPSMNFKSFQSIISQTIGISPHQFTTYLADNGCRQNRLPVTNKFNFAAAIPDFNSAFFFVVLKRRRRSGRRERNFMLRRRNPNRECFCAEKLLEMDLLERHLSSLNLNSNVYSDIDNQDWIKLIDELRHISSINSDMNLCGNHGGGLSYTETGTENDDSLKFKDGFGYWEWDVSNYSNGDVSGTGNCNSWKSSDDGTSSTGGGSENRVFSCDVCLSATTEGETAPFHWCKNDPIFPITMAHRSPFGPIGPPLKNKLCLL